MGRLSIIAWAGLALLAAGCSGTPHLGPEGASTSTSTSTTTTYEMGSGTGSSFDPDVIGLSSTSLSAGGTTTLSVSVVDQNNDPYTGAAVTVTFTSGCISEGTATIAASGASTAGTTPDTATSSIGIIDATYTAKGCVGEDVIYATATVGTSNLTATGTVTVAAASAGAIQSVSAVPESISLKGTGSNETATLVYKVVDSTGAPHPGVAVAFTSADGLSLSPATAVSGADGTVQTAVSSDSEHTRVRVTATMASPRLSTQSSALTVKSAAAAPIAEDP